jgi:hypothetical protein
MSTAEKRESAARPDAKPERRTHPADELEDYAGGYIQARHGRVDAWLLAVYVVLFGWALYYLYVYWGSLGPGLAI